MAFDQSKHFVASKLQVADSGVLIFNSSDTQTQAFHGFYGAFSDYTTQTIASTTTAYRIAIGQTDESSGVSLTNGGRISIAHEGTYNLQWSGQFENADVTDSDAYVWMRKNGNDVVGSTGYISIPSKHGGINGHTIAGWNFVLSLAAGDYVELWWAAESTSVSIATYAAANSPVRPSTASIVATMTQVR